MHIFRLNPKIAFLGILVAIGLALATVAWAFEDYKEYNDTAELTGGGPTIDLEYLGAAYAWGSADDWTVTVWNESTQATNMGVYGWGQEMCVGQWGATQTGYTSDAESNTTVLGKNLYIEKNKDECMIFYLYCRTSGYHTWFKSGYGSEDAGERLTGRIVGINAAHSTLDHPHQERVAGISQAPSRPVLTSRILERLRATTHAG